MKRTAAPCLGLLLALLLGQLVRPALAAAQGSWPTVHQQALWVTTVFEHEVSDRTALWFDGNWRRMGTGAEPQQVLLRPGVLVTLAPGVRVGGGYAYVATAPYGERPAATPTREHRAWQQLSLQHAAGPLTLVHRYRTEQRWLAPVVNGETGRFEYQQRVRYQLRAQRASPSAAGGGRGRLWFAQDEVLLPVGYNGAAGRFTQNRFALGVGLPIGARQRLDVAYMNLWNALPQWPANEVNHTVTFTWVVPSGR